MNVWKQPEMGCDGSRPADCSRRAVLRRRRRCPAPIVVRRVAGTMRSADDAERRLRRDSALAHGQLTHLHDAFIGHAHASRLYSNFVLTGCSETRPVSAQLVLNTCIPMRQFTSAFTQLYWTPTRTVVPFSSVHVLWTSLYVFGRIFVDLHLYL